MTTTISLPDVDEAARLGRSLRAVDASLLKRPPPGRRTAWWHGDEPYLDVFFEHDDDGLAWVEATVRGRSLRWDRRDRALKTGLTGELEGGTMQPASKLVVDDRDVDPAVVDVVLAVLAARDEAVFADARAAIEAAR